MLLRRRLLLLFVVVILGVAVLGGVARSLVRSRDDTAEHGRTVRVAREHVERLRAAYSDQETGERGYVISASDDLLGPYGEGRREATRLIRSLRADASDIEGIEPRIDRGRRVGGPVACAGGGAGDRRRTQRQSGGGARGDRERQRCRPVRSVAHRSRRARPSRDRRWRGRERPRRRRSAASSRSFSSCSSSSCSPARSSPRG